MKNIFYFLLLSILFLLDPGCTAQNKELAVENTFSDDQLALDLLVNFLECLNNGDYVEAARFYGGSYETMIDQNPGVSPNDLSALLQNACTLNGMQCLRVRSVELNKKVSETEFVFQVDFLKNDGNIFELDPCCGGDEADIPSQSMFYFTVIKVSNNQFSVMDMPPYAP